MTGPDTSEPFARFRGAAPPSSALRARIAAACRAPEAACAADLLASAAMPPAEAVETERLARHLVERLRARGPVGGVQGLLREYSLSSQEGVALMCLAEALLRIPDAATRDALIRDKTGPGDWLAHLGHSPSLFVNAATWGLALTGGLAAARESDGLAAALARLVARGGEPVIRQAVDRAMRWMGEQFVTGQTIAAALHNSRSHEARGFTYSYDMLGEAAMTQADADRYDAQYAQAIDAIGAASVGRGIRARDRVLAGPGISIKLSALHPRYARSQRDRVMAELLPRLAALARRACGHGIGLNIDAEEADRLDLSLDLLEALCGDPALAGWDGLGFVVQAYQKRAPHVIDWLVALARRHRRRLMIRLVKGAYWDAEIKRAQVEGLAGFPVFTRKVHTDVSYRACARRLLDAPDAVFPQFATHNAETVAAIHTMAGPDFAPGRYEFQCLHGMGEALYDAVVGRDGLNRPCRIYAPVGTHETLLAYLVRRLLENGANASFIHRLADPAVPVADLVADPAARVRADAYPGAPHPAIRAPLDLFPDRANAAGLDLTDEATLAAFEADLRTGAAAPWRAVPVLTDGLRAGTPRAVRNPADGRAVVGTVVEADAETVVAALSLAEAAAGTWAETTGALRADILARAADAMAGAMPDLVGLLVREAGKCVADAVAEVREAIDFLRYYGGKARGFGPATHRPLGIVACISPWNFPLSIFTGQVAAALCAGNVVLAKPAGETPLVAAHATRLLLAAGLPPGALQFLPGPGETGARLVADPRVRGVLFTGSTEVARSIQAVLAERLSPEDDGPVPLVAETGGLNALLVDSSALTEQVVADTLVSAFGCAGQRCSALRLLCLQDSIADRTLAMLKGALAERRIGNPDRLATDIGPVITDAARDRILAHIAAMRAAGYPVHQATLPEECAAGSFVPPTLIEIPAVSDLTHEVFGPVLHVVRFPREAFGATLAAVNATGYGLTFGVHTRLDATMDQACARAEAGTVYVNRSLVGAVVGVQPFGGHGRSGTGPKAGGPLTLHRLLSACPAETGLPGGTAPSAAAAWAAWLRQHGDAPAAGAAERLIRLGPVGIDGLLPGPVGEANRYALHPRGRVLCAATTRAGLVGQVGAALATGSRAILRPSEAARILVAELHAAPALPAALTDHVRLGDVGECDVALWPMGEPGLPDLARALATQAGAIVPILTPRLDPATGARDYPLEMLVLERTTCIDTTAAGGNASLLALV
ncbi:bifunctional proline dehydrogenase/L-glutamate gamma-semialdehyde dehydrogenase PutA [Methylobacterium sp. J-090]|uniref:bifunctional proline dehydrogenase/L-glutamate gamma-semialdehyde dehydrogenase PutA n=1 Tax=Methylobacterium sp. J-090 TaxID=2836666 RepID=UPI001FBB696E|nr:bifunctional proline dehydrogenase/L-glutamate gamma-semialdehyde dehydrogenase PutA [Methylobacterium sp. J-090]MCJ2083850.1 bifunctional proline dehydrogenase/L-glutamate gamma-semialdehyde dehydrogenase PutA [Methylobacterium sp. J-090]